MNETATTVTLVPHLDDIVEILHKGLILARAWKDKSTWHSERMHALKGIHDRRTHASRSDAIGRLVTLAMQKQAEADTD